MNDASKTPGLDHPLRPHFESLRQFSSTPALEASPLYARLSPEIGRVLGGVVQEALGREAFQARASIRATAWNIERGRQLDNIIHVLREHPTIRESDVLLLTELDYGMARSGNRNVPREIARALGLHYVFAPCYVNLSKGSGLEDRADRDNAQALHGNAVFSRHPLRDAHAVSLPNGKDKLRGKEKRLGSQRAVVATMDHPLGALRVVSLHLDAHSAQQHRHRQMKLVLDHLDGLQPALPTLIGGDWNTSTYNSQRALYAILGFWRRVFMGVSYVIRNHYAHPDRWFERRLFRELEQRGYGYRDLNKPGGCTLHYDVQSLALNSNLGDWIPQWCFRFINWSLREHQGRCSFKLDWFSGRGIVPASPPEVVERLCETYGPLSDHDPIVLDFLPRL
ncbi:MAG: hypothetical protein EXS64_08200 [Candidatus Latescibacteria bacterium]|nr:hypothetical protein [Candidatus Latescibacterota bacterium]